MKRIVGFSLGLLLTCSVLFGQQKSGTKPASKLPEVKQYWFVLLKTGPNTDADSASKMILFQKHMANIERLQKKGILKVAGPFGQNNNQWRGIFIFDCATKEDAESIVQTDPAVAAGLFDVEVIPWWTPATGSFTPAKTALEH